MRVVVHGIPIINTYVPNGYKIRTPQHEYKLKWFARLKSYFSQHLDPNQPALWCGDMNVAPEAIDVHSPEKHLRHVCFHESVRTAYKDAVSWGFVDVWTCSDTCIPISSNLRFGTIFAPARSIRTKAGGSTISWQHARSPKNAQRLTWTLSRAGHLVHPTIRSCGHDLSCSGGL